MSAIGAWRTLSGPGERGEGMVATMSPLVRALAKGEAEIYLANEARAASRPRPARPRPVQHHPRDF
jgi:hypothetical protein